MTRIAATIVLLTLGLVALAWSALRAYDAIMGGDGPTVGITPEHRRRLDGNGE